MLETLTASFTDATVSSGWHAIRIVGHAAQQERSQGWRGGACFLRSRKNHRRPRRIGTLVWRVPPQLYSFRQLRHGLKRFKAALSPLAHLNSQRGESTLWVLSGSLYIDITVGVEHVSATNSHIQSSTGASLPLFGFLAWPIRVSSGLLHAARAALFLVP